MLRNNFETESVVDRLLSTEELLAIGTLIEQVAPSYHDLVDDERKNQLRQIYSRYETMLEISFARQYMSGDVPPVQDYGLWHRFQRLTSAEIAYLLPDTSGKRVHFVGCGPFPVSSILYAKLFGLNVCCVDRDRFAIEDATQVVERLELEKQIEFQNIAGEMADYSDSDCVIVAVLAMQKDRIIARVNQTLKPGKLLICRTATPPNDFFYPVLDIDIPVRFREVGFHRAGSDDTISFRAFKAE